MIPLDSVKQFLDTVKPISEWLRCEKYDSLRIDCMHETGTYLSTVYMENDFKRTIKCLREPRRKFDSNTFYKVRAFSMKPIFKPIDEAIYTEGSFKVLDLERIAALDVDCFRLEVDCKMNTDYLSGLIHPHSSREALREKTKYHLSAELKDPASLIKGFSEVQIDEYPVTAVVYIHENVSIPQYIRDLLNRRREKIVSSTPYDPLRKEVANNPHNIQHLVRMKQEQIKFSRKYNETNTFSRLRQLSTFLHSNEIYDYFIMPPQTDFRLEKCAPSDDSEAFGQIQLPNTVNVLSRTDLTLKKPAANGTLTYEEGKFSERIKGILEE